MAPTPASFAMRMDGGLIHAEICATKASRNLLSGGELPRPPGACRGFFLTVTPPARYARRCRHRLNRCGRRFGPPRAAVRHLSPRR